MIRRRAVLALVVSGLLIGMAAPAAAGPSSSSQAPSGAGGPAATRPVVREASRSDTSQPLRAYPAKPAVLDEIFTTRPAKLLPNREGTSGPAGPDPALQEDAAGPGAPTSQGSFEGVGNVNGVLPPDTVGDIGPNHYVQMVNLAFAVFDRSGNLLDGPRNNNTLFTGFGGPCETTNNGDPIVLYDERADRWMLSQFALPRFPRGPFYQCIAVSQTGDPTGAYHRYEFKISDSKLNDYPKFGVWNDTYFMAINQFSCNFITCSWGGQGVVAFERDRMLNGQTARMIYFDLFNLDENLGGMLPADFDGASPPAGSPGIFSQVDDNAWGYSGDQLQVWEFAADWANPSSSTFTHRQNLAVSAFDSNMCGYSRNCISQPGGTKVDAISDRLMNRLQYRNFGTHQTLVVNHTVDVNAADRAGVRWYELRKTSSAWSINQQGTYSPDANHRWMASLAMNGAGDMALGYSVSSTSVHPSIRVTGRLDGDPAGQMTQGELTIVGGAGSQSHSSGRWGDYSAMSVDPTDDCTFWYTQEYYAANSSAGWQTRVGSFRLRDCGGGGNTTPVADDLAASGAEDTVIGWTPSVSDADGDPLTCSIATSPAQGSAVVASNCSSGTYTPAANYNGGDSFTYRVSDGSATDTGTVTVTVSPVNDAPAAANDAYATTAETTLNVAAPGVLGNDSDVDGNSLSAVLGSGPTNGSLTLNANGSFSYTPNTGFTGDDSFTYRASDGSLLSNLATVTISVGAAATGMHVGDLDRASTSQGSTWTAFVTITIHDSNHNPVSGAVVSGSWSGAASGSASCTTNASGQCTVSVSGIHKRNASVTFGVTNVTHATLSYSSAANHDPDGDSNGTTIAVLKP